MSSLFEKLGGKDAIDNLAGTLQELGVADELIAKAGAVAESVRDEVLDR